MAVPTDEQDALLQKLRDLIERSGEKEDTFGSEMADDARVWRVYSKAAQKHDKELLAQWNGTLDTLLIFAGLFSAVSTTFIIDAYKQMQPDYAQETFRLLLANMSGTRYMEPSGHVEESARAVNCLWISSLIASLSTALIAILAKQWLASYPVSDRENLREWAQLRQYRFDALERWHVPVLVAVVPVLLHLSLMLFLAGLVVFLWDIDTGTMILALILSAATYGLYGFTTLSPVLWSSSPFRTPLTQVLQQIAHQCVEHTAKALVGLYCMMERISRPVSLVGDVLVAVARHTGGALSSPAMIYRLRHGAVDAFTRGLVTVYSLVIDPISRLYYMAVRGARRCGDSLIGQVAAAVMCPTGVVLHSLAVSTLLCFLALHAVTLRITDTCSLTIDTICNLCRICRRVVQFLCCNSLHWRARWILSFQRPSALPVDPWSTQTVFSDRVIARALSWLALSAETTDIYYSVLDGLGDADRGAAIADDLASPLKTRISVQTSDLISGRAPYDLQAVVTHLRAMYHLRNLLSSPDVTAWVSDQVRAVRFSRTKLRSQRDYDTLLRACTMLEKTDAYEYLSRFFGCPAGQQVCESPSAILSSTARSVAQLFVETREADGYLQLRGNILLILSALRSHLVASPDLAAKLLTSSFVDGEGVIESEGSLRKQPPHDCDPVACEAMNYLVFILARYDFNTWTTYMSTEVGYSLKARTFETLVLFCRVYPRSNACTYLKANLTFWLSGEDPLSELSFCGRDVAAFVPYFPTSLSRSTRVRLIRQLLRPDNLWFAPDSPDCFADDGLNACLGSIDRLFDLELHEMRVLLDDASLEPLQRASHWNDSSLLRWCAEVLASGRSDGTDIEGLVSKFIFCEAKSGRDGTTIIRTWDLVIAGSQQILALAARPERFGRMTKTSLKTLCDSLGELRRRYPHRARWKEMGERVRIGINNPSRNAGTSTRYASGMHEMLEEFCAVMEVEDSPPD